MDKTDTTVGLYGDTAVNMFSPDLGEQTFLSYSPITN